VSRFVEAKSFLWSFISIQELNYAVGDFFDQALYYLAQGFEAQAKEEEEHKYRHDPPHRRRLATA
jgi:hypothetical protein